MALTQIINTKRKGQILTVAQQLFRDYGYAATSMRQLASKIGIEPASMYSHIKGKEDLLQEICFGMAEEFMQAQDDIAKLNLPAIEHLQQAIIAHVEVITKDIDAAAVFFHDWRHLSGTSLQSFKKLRFQYEDNFRKIIRRGIEEDVLRKVDEKFMVLTIFSAMNWTYEWYKPDSGMSGTEIGSKVAEILLNGLIK